MAAQLQVDGVVIHGGSIDVALRPDDFITRGLAHRKTERSAAAHPQTRGKAFVRSFRRYAENRTANNFTPERKTFAFGYRVGRPESHVCPRASNDRGNALMSSVALSTNSLAPRAKTACGCVRIHPPCRLQQGQRNGAIAAR